MNTNSIKLPVNFKDTKYLYHESDNMKVFENSN